VPWRVVSLRTGKPTSLNDGPKARLPITCFSNPSKKHRLHPNGQAPRYHRPAFPKVGAWNNGSITVNNGSMLVLEDGKGHSLL